MSHSENLYQIIWLSRPLMQAAEAIVEQNLKGSGLTVRMRAMLEILAKKGSLSVPEIADHLHIQRQYVQLMINETLAAGLTEKRPNPRHKRSMRIALTESGNATIRNVTAKEMALMQQLSDSFDPAAIDTTLDVTKRLIKTLSARTAKPTP